MINDEGIATLVVYEATNWPNFHPASTYYDILAMELNSVDATFDEAMTALREEGSGRDFAPTPMQLRDAVLRRRKPVKDWDEALRELADAVRTFGYTPSLDEPDWMPELSPGVETYVRRRYGSWAACCREMPAVNGFDQASNTAAQVFTAQFRDEYRAITSRAHQEITRATLHGPTRVAEILSEDAQS